MKHFKLFVPRIDANRQSKTLKAIRKAGWVTTLAAGAALLMCGLSRPVLADTPAYEIYLYNSQGVPVDVTQSYYCFGDYVYSDATNAAIGYASYQRGHIYDFANNDIGLLVSNS